MYDFSCIFFIRLYSFEQTLTKYWFPQFFFHDKISYSHSCLKDSHSLSKWYKSASFFRMVWVAWLCIEGYFKVVCVFNTIKEWIFSIFRFCHCVSTQIFDYPFASDPRLFWLPRIFLHFPVCKKIICFIYIGFSFFLILLSCFLFNIANFL